MPHWSLFYHVVWATRDRVPLLADSETVETFEKAVEAVCREQRIIIHAIGTMPDHVHLAVSIPPSVAISLVIQQLKGSSSHLLNKTVFANGYTKFSWQAEYGVYSFSERSLPNVIKYVRDQRTRHADSHLWANYEITHRPFHDGGKDQNHNE